MGAVKTWRKTAADRFELHVVRGPGCWEWIGVKNKKGYALLWLGTRYTTAHRWAWEQEHGPMAAGLEAEHLCHNRGCVNPAHVQASDHVTNVRRSGNMAKTHCRWGHAYTPENTYYMKPQPGRVTPRRGCRACRRRDRV